MITAKIVADSVSPQSHRITTFLLTYPRFIHSEFMTHRMFSRNAASSRAIPFRKMIADISALPACPVWWGAEQKGMQSGDEIANKVEALYAWQEAAKSAIEQAQKLAALGLHKSICNRVIEPFAHMTTLCTATEYNNFFNLRAHRAAQPEFQELAFQMLDLYLASKPRAIGLGGWHLPFADQYIAEGLSSENLLKISTARAARTSYLNMEGEIDHSKDYDLHDRLSEAGHWSPFEHAAQPMLNPNWCGNFFGWLPYRKKFPSENQTVLKAVPRGSVSIKA